ncbi:unnamed protein product [Phytophthora lilii]|uniref:Unnamed protein product n=1 Tax=Phytophthora lilii TaxID=2077276 RepID=A0A9W6XGP9_9STRA|nr:unnamed protein product [Phytophthora lilii]
MKANIAGGPSIIFNRYAKRNETKIRGGKVCKKIIGYDANALYLWALGNEMPCGRLTTAEAYEGIIDDINADKIFGFLESDIRTPDHLKHYFSEITPIFKNVLIDCTDESVIGKHMFDHNDARKQSRAKPARKLINSYFGKKILIYTPLLKWLKHSTNPSKIEHYNNDPGDHGTMGKIERFNRTLKQRLTKMSPKRITQKLIADVIENYNSTFHRSIGMTPNKAKGKVMDADLSHNQVEADRIEKEFQIGSSVLYRLMKQTFDKEAARWSKAVYTESKSVQKWSYLLQDTK